MSIQEIKSTNNVATIILENINKRHSYDLIIASSFFDENLKGIIKFLSLVNASRKIIKSIKIIGDKDELTSKITIDPESIFDDIKFEIRYHISKKLFHPKAITLTSITDENIKYGWIMSANSTQNGYFGGNIEIINSIEDADDVEDLHLLLTTMLKNKNSTIYNFNEESTNINSNLHLHKILESGYFLHKWTANISQLTSFKIDIDNKRSDFNNDPTINQWGVTESKSLSMDILSASKLKQINISSAFFKDFTIETYLGRWCLKKHWDIIIKEVKKRVDFDSYIKSFQLLASEENLQIASLELVRRLEYLHKNDYIKYINNEKVENWKNSIRDIRNNISDYTERLLIGYYHFELPYPKGHPKIIDLHQSLIESAKISKNPYQNSVKMHFKINHHLLYEANTETIERCKSSIE